MITLSRQSGLPVSDEKLEEFKSEWRLLFDKAMEEIKDMQTLAEKLEVLETELRAKYELEIKINQPKSAKALKALLVQYGPVMFGFDTDDKLRGVIMDQSE